MAIMLFLADCQFTIFERSGIMKLWGGRFTKETNQLVHNFNSSISFDQKFYRQDIMGSIAHATVLAKQGSYRRMKETYS